LTLNRTPRSYLPRLLTSVSARDFQHADSFSAAAKDRRDRKRRRSCAVGIAAAPRASIPRDKGVPRGRRSRNPGLIIRAVGDRLYLCDRGKWLCQYKVGKWSWKSTLRNLLPPGFLIPLRLLPFLPPPFFLIARISRSFMSARKVNK